MQDGQVRGRYAIYDEIAAGGMATVHLGRLSAPGGFSRTVAIKKLHPHLAKHPDFVAMFLDEARMAARIRHAHVVATLDVVVDGSTILLVMEYVHGESLSKALRVARAKSEPVPPSVAVAILAQTLYGLHAAHEAHDENGSPLHIVHRDVSPQNIIVGADGIARVLDFGVAKAALRTQSTQEGQLKGKIAYMSPEQVRAEPLDRRADVFAAAIVLWETLTCQRLFDAETPTRSISDIETKEIKAPGISAALDAVVLRGLERVPKARFQTARDMAVALETAVQPATSREIAEWIEAIAGPALAQRAALVRTIEQLSGGNATADAPTAPGDRRTVPEPAPVDVDVVISNVTETPVTGAPLRVPMRSRAPWAVAAVLVLAAGGAVVLSKRPLAPQASSPLPVIVTHVADVTSASSMPPPVAAVPITSEQTTIVRPAQPTAHAPRTVRALPTSPAASTVAAPLPNPCSPPYVIEADGSHRFKPECVHY